MNFSLPPAPLDEPEMVRAASGRGTVGSGGGVLRAGLETAVVVVVVVLVASAVPGNLSVYKSIRPS